MSRAYEEAMERRRDAYVAQALGITIEMLDAHPFQINEIAGNSGVVYSWHVVWDGEAPSGLRTDNSAGIIWSDIPPAPDEPDEEDRDA